MNNDTHLTEQEALNQAAAEGIYFEDFYIIMDVNTMQTKPEHFTTRQEAEAAIAELDNSDQYAVAQGRRQKQSNAS